MPTKENLSTKEVAAIMGVSVKTVNVWAAQGKLPIAETEKLSGARFFDPAVVAAFDPKSTRSSDAPPASGERVSHDSQTGAKK